MVIVVERVHESYRPIIARIIGPRRKQRGFNSACDIILLLLLLLPALSKGLTGVILVSIFARRLRRSDIAREISDETLHVPHVRVAWGWSWSIGRESGK